MHPNVQIVLLGFNFAKTTHILQATNGKHTFENLVALLRDSYLKYMQVGAIWEAIARQPNPPANRNRAK